MAEGLDFSQDVGSSDIYYWENYDAGWVNNEIANLIARINNVDDNLESMVYRNDYESTSEGYTNLWMNDLGTSGWISYFYNTNKDNFEPFIAKKTYPSWYGTAEPAQKQKYDSARKCFTDCAALIKPMTELRKIMMLIPLKESFKFMRVTYNFDSAGFTTTLYQKINNDLKTVSNIINSNWNTLESGAIASKNYYDQYAGKVSRSEMISGYRQARMKDYLADLQTSPARDSFIANSSGIFSVSSSHMAKLRVIDKYTLQIASLNNIEDDMKAAMESLRKLNEDLGKAYGAVSGTPFTELLNALDSLRTTIYDYCESGLHVYTSYKNHETEMPYIFVCPLPCLNEIKVAYGFEPLTADPWKDGTAFEAMYTRAAKALSLHCYDFVYEHGHPELK